ncbi:MAG: CaiB/BaiF CoA transferase family protein [Myxococcales bacterium]|nr:CoA transferase [Myxococcales bacterium]
MAEKPLAGLRVLDLSRLLPGPYASLLLSDLGADVVKVEDSGAGDYLRQVAPSMYAPLNRGKRSIVVDLPSGDFDELVARADVLIESFRPGVLERLVPSTPERLIVCRISGFGQADSDWRDRAGHDIGYLALAGVLAFNRAQPAVQLADLFGGAQQAVIGVLAALVERARTGLGRVVDVSLTHGSTGLLLAADAARLLDGSRPCYRVYRCAAGFFALGALEPKFWQRFCAAVGRPEWIDGAFDPALVPDVDALFLTRTRDEWNELLFEADCSGEPVLSPDELRAHPLFGAAFAGDVLRTFPALSPDVPLGPAPSQGQHALSDVLRDWR